MVLYLITRIIYLMMGFYHGGLALAQKPLKLTPRGAIITTDLDIRMSLIVGS